MEPGSADAEAVAVRAHGVGARVKISEVEPTMAPTPSRRTGRAAPARPASAAGAGRAGRGFADVLDPQLLAGGDGEADGAAQDLAAAFPVLAIEDNLVILLAHHKHGRRIENPPEAVNGRPAGRSDFNERCGGPDRGRIHPSGGAGIQADLKTFSALSVYGAAAVAALTAQNTLGVLAVHELPPAFVLLQVDAVLADLQVGAMKIGMLGGTATIEAVAERLGRGDAPKLVLDPVMVAKGGAALLASGALRALRERLVPLALVLTPNLPEAAALLGEEEAEVLFDPEGACTRLLRLGPRSVVLKGGHGGGETSEDLFCDGTALLRLSAPRTATRNTHGTGCTFSAAIAACLARGMGVEEAVRRAKGYVTAAIAAADRLGVGHGQGPVHHFFDWWPANEGG